MALSTGMIRTWPNGRQPGPPAAASASGAAASRCASTPARTRSPASPTTSPSRPATRRKLGYLLVDRYNVLFVDQVGLYLGWQGLLLKLSVRELLSTAASGGSPDLAALREGCFEALADDIESAAIWRLRQLSTVSGR
jgi:hypothetical protein